MLQHNILLAIRNFKRNKGLFIINLLGLSTGLAGALLIYLWIYDEVSVDKFHEKDKGLFQVMKNSSDPMGGIATHEWLPALLPQALLNEMPEVDASVAVVPYLNGRKRGIISYGDQHLKASDQYVSSDFFNVFTFPLIQGDKNQVLSDKYAVVISDELALKLFKTDNVIGKSVEWDQQPFSGTFQITGVFKRTPHNSTFQFDLAFNFELYREKKPHVESWTYNDPCTYIVLKPGTDIDQFNKKLFGFLKEKSSEDVSLFTRPFSDKYLFGKYDNGIQVGGRIEYIELFSLIAVCIVLIACINFMNISTAKSSTRLKEIGVKKAVGAGRKEMLFQYLGESIIMTLVSLVLATIIVALLLPQFNSITSKHLTLGIESNMILSVIILASATAFIAGGYPAIYLSSLKPSVILKGKLKNSTTETWARKGLVAFQFTISIILIASVFVVVKQLEFLESKDLGYERSNVICFKKEGRLVKDFETFLLEATALRGVVSASSTWGNMTVADTYTTNLDWDGKRPDDKIEFASLQVNYDFVKTLSIKLKEGRDFSRDFVGDDKKIIFNKVAIDEMGLKDPIGMTIRLWGEDRQIIGVVENFHFESLYEDLQPCFIMLLPVADNIMIKLRQGMESETIAQLHDMYKDFNQGLPFDYKFLGDDHQSLYASENRVAVLAKYFAIVAITIACMGLFALATFTAERRSKEIGIRKILGSSNLGIARLLSRDFMMMVFVAILVALPASYFISQNWLDNFAYHIDLKLWFFVAAAVISLVVAWLTVAIQTIKGANVNPTQCLRNE